MIPSINSKVMLIILDGWGVAPPSVGNAIDRANTPFFDELVKKYFSTTLQASGISVGLPTQEAGNSEVGHLNIGAGRIVYQYLSQITQDLRQGSFYKNPVFLQAIDHAKNNKSNLHIMGMFSTGNVHGSMEHFFGLLDIAAQQDFHDVIVHPFLDGKEGPPKESLTTIEELGHRIKKFTYKTPGTIMGRMYALDRNNNWELTEMAYNALTEENYEKETDNVINYIKECHKDGLTDYDIEPAITKNVPRIKDNDSIICTDFREDSIRQLARCFILPENGFTYFNRKFIKNIFFVALTEYERNLPMNVAYSPPVVKTNLSYTISEAGKRQLHVAETEKYAHVTYFFNGENEISYSGEDRVLVRSDQNPDYEKNPAMKIESIVEETIKRISKYDFFILNIPNADIVGHTGNMDSTMKGIEAIDRYLKVLIEAALPFNITPIITSDHGNAEAMIDLKTGNPIPHHSHNPVPLIIVGKKFRVRVREAQELHKIKTENILADVAPTILHIMGIEKPADMTGSSILDNLSFAPRLIE